MDGTALNITMISWIAASIGISVAVSVWLISNHAKGKHTDSVSLAMFKQYMDHAREWRETFHKDLQEIKRILSKRDL